MIMTDILKTIIFGIVEGVTEWLPVSSTGHMILLNEFVKLNVSSEFLELFLVVIQLGAIIAVLVLFWSKIFPFSFHDGNFIQKDIVILWFKIVIACIPGAVVELLWGNRIEALFYNYRTVAIMLVFVGILFILVENWNHNRVPKIKAIGDISYMIALYIGIFQVVAAVFPGTSRSGATILGALALGVSRTVAAEFTFLLAIPVMFGASFLKLLKFGMNFSAYELSILILGMAVSFLVSLVVIKFLMDYIKKHDFKFFGWYRIVLGIVVLGYFELLR